MQARAELVFTSGARAGERVPLDQGRTVIGRQVGDLIIDDQEVSSIHAIISFERGGWYVMDLGSTNGVFVDDQVKLEARLRDSTQVRFGQTSFQFNLAAEGEEASGPPDLLAGGSNSDLMTLPHSPPGQGSTLVNDDSVKARQAAEQAPRAAPPLAAKAPPVPAPAPPPVRYDDPPPPSHAPAGVADGPAVRVVLEIIEGADAGNVRRFAQESVLVGRLNTDLVVRDSDVSRRHCIIEVFDASQVYLRDLNSTNGTFVNGRRVSSVRLRNGDQIRLGRCLVRFGAHPNYPNR